MCDGLFGSWWPASIIYTIISTFRYRNLKKKFKKNELNWSKWGCPYLDSIFCFLILTRYLINILVLFSTCSRLCTSHAIFVMVKLCVHKLSNICRSGKFEMPPPEWNLSNFVILLIFCNRTSVAQHICNCCVVIFNFVSRQLHFNWWRHRSRMNYTIYNNSTFRTFIHRRLFWQNLSQKTSLY